MRKFFHVLLLSAMFALPATAAPTASAITADAVSQPAIPEIATIERSLAKLDFTTVLQVLAPRAESILRSTVRGGRTNVNVIDIIDVIGDITERSAQNDPDVYRDDDGYDADNDYDYESRRSSGNDRYDADDKYDYESRRSRDDDGYDADDDYGYENKQSSDDDSVKASEKANKQPQVSPSSSAPTVTAKGEDKATAQGEDEDLEAQFLESGYDNFYDFLYDKWGLDN